MITALEGNRMAKAGRGGPALATAAIGSFVAGTHRDLGLAFLAPWLVEIAIQFGPADYFALMVLAFVTVSATFGDSPLRGLTSLFVGLVLGLDRHRPPDRPGAAHLRRAGAARRHRGDDARGRAVRGRRGALRRLAAPARARRRSSRCAGSLWMTSEDWRRSWKPWLRGTALGFPIGALPAGGAEIPTFLSYTIEKRLSKHPEEFGKGAIEGVAGPEAANNAVRRRHAGAAADARPADLGDRGDHARRLPAVRAQPGPLLFAERPDLVWGLIASLFIANVMLVS